MRLTEILINTAEKSSTGSSTIDNMLSEAFDATIGMNSLPVEVRSSQWKNLENPRRLSRIFSFDSADKQRYFINELLHYQERHSHHCRMTIDGSQVLIETYTHDINDITNLDLKLASFADEIFRDTQFFRNGR